MFPHLMAPGRIGSLTIRNRILMCPMGDSLGNDDGTVSERQAAYFEARARGGAGLLLVGSVAVAYPAGSYDTHQLGISEDRFVPGLKDLTDRAHRHGAAIATQLVHDGLNARNDMATGRPLLVASIPEPSPPDALSMMVTSEELDAMMTPLRQPGARIEFQVATEDDLAWAIECFVTASRRARDAGFDGVELHAGHGYLLDGFLSPVSNRRTDRWGGSVENRSRLLCEVIRAVREDLGGEFPLWFRFNAVERYLPGGETLEDAVQVARLAVDAGADAVHVSAYANRSVAIGITDAHTPHQPGALLGYAAAVKAVVDVPVITFGRMEPDAAEAALAAGQADFVAMGRKLLADPDLPSKLAAGRVDEVRPCIYQYRCIGNIFVGSSVACVVNPATGHEDRWPIPASARPRRILVVGGGPAGLETARLLAGAGHTVTLWEAGTRLGGRLALAARTDPTLDRLLGWLLRQVDGAGVELVVGQEATPDTIAAFGADEVVVATGAVWGRPGVPGGDRVRTVDDLGPWLDSDDTPAGDTPAGGTATVGRTVAIIGGGRAGLSLAGLCVARGRTVAVLEPTSVFATEMGLPGRFRVVHDLEVAGVSLLAGVAVESISADTVTYRDATGAQGSVAAETVIGATATFSEAVLPGSRVGDCAGVRGIEGAMLDAAEAARSYG